MKLCGECGTLSSDDTVFCTVCGKRFSNNEEVIIGQVASNIPNNDVTNAIKADTGVDHPVIIPLLQRIDLFLEDGEFERADDYCERILDIEPTNADAYIDKLLVEFHCNTREQLKTCTSSITNSKNYAKVVRFGNEKQKSFVIETEKCIQSRLALLLEKRQEIETEVAETTTDYINQNINNETNLLSDIDIEEDYYIDIRCPHCGEELSYTNWEIIQGGLVCPMCDFQFEFNEGMRR